MIRIQLFQFNIFSHSEFNVYEQPEKSTPMTFYRYLVETLLMSKKSSLLLSPDITNRGAKRNIDILFFFHLFRYKAFKTIQPSW